MSSADADMAVANWRKSRRSVAGGACVEAASGNATVVVRDSTDPSGPKMRYPAKTWQAFVTALKTGQQRLPQSGATERARPRQRISHLLSGPLLSAAATRARPSARPPPGPRQAASRARRQPQSHHQHHPFTLYIFVDRELRIRGETPPVPGGNYTMRSRRGADARLPRPGAPITARRSRTPHG